MVELEINKPEVVVWVFLAGQQLWSDSRGQHCDQREEQGVIFHGCTGCLFCSTGKETHLLLSPSACLYCENWQDELEFKP